MPWICTRRIRRRQLVLVHALLFFVQTVIHTVAGAGWHSVWPYFIRICPDVFLCKAVLTQCGHLSKMDPVGRDRQSFAQRAPVAQ